jgi:hypothetical protein
MRKIVFLSTFALLAVSFTQAQIKQDPERSRVKRTAPPPPTTGTPVNKTTNTESTAAPVYHLTSVRVKIKTGNDNKEFPSYVNARLGRRNQANGEGWVFFQDKLNNEMRVNSETEFGLDKASGSFQGAGGLDALQSAGLKLQINYVPNFFADAWKIEGITVTLEFKDQFGNLHPTLGNKTIVFTNAYGFLDNTYYMMECQTDGSFAPMTAFIRKLGK